jgi:antitoxin (DNA-binding transcriptional repressor) of toxin-antitoxin stability system
MLVIGSREFRTNQAQYFDRIDKGEQIVIQRKKGKSYALTPIDPYFTPEMLAEIEEALEQAKQGKVTTCKTYEETLKFLDSL